MEEIWNRAASNLCKERPVYARVDLSKKMKNRLAEKANREPLTTADNCCTNFHFYQNRDYVERLSNLNYMNLEFTDSLRYYENLRELSSKTRKKTLTIGMDCLNIDVPDATIGSTTNGINEVCCRCICVSEMLTNSQDKVTTFPIVPPLGNYVSMSPLKRTRSSDAVAITTQTRASLEDRENSISLEWNNSKKSSRSVHKPNTTTLATAELNTDFFLRDHSRTTPLGDGDSKPKSGKSSQENSDTQDSSYRANDMMLSSNVGRFPNNTDNHNSSSSNDSGFSPADSLKYVKSEFIDFQKATTVIVSTKRCHDFNQHQQDSAFQHSSSMSRRSKSSDPLGDLTFHFHPDCTHSLPPDEFSSTGVELPFYLKGSNAGPGKLLVRYQKRRNVTISDRYLDLSHDDTTFEASTISMKVDLQERPKHTFSF